MSGRIEISGFENFGEEGFPCGYITFTDGMRIGYGPGTRQANKDGLFEPNQAFAMRNRSLSPSHWLIAQKWVSDFEKTST
jgi:hypothetical protein